MSGRFSLKQTRIVALTAAIVLMAAIALPVRSVLAASGLLNGDLETDSNIDGLPDSWKAKNVSFEAGDGYACDTSCSFRFVGNGDGTKLKQDILMEGLAGDDFELSFDTASTEASTSGNYRVVVKIFHISGGSDSFKFDAPEGDNGWTTYTYGFEASADYFKVRVQAQFTGTYGWVWFDNFSIGLVP